MKYVIVMLCCLFLCGLATAQSLTDYVIIDDNNVDDFSNSFVVSWEMYYFINDYDDIRFQNGFRCTGRDVRELLEWWTRQRRYLDVMPLDNSDFLYNNGLIILETDVKP